MLRLGQAAELSMAGHVSRSRWGRLLPQGLSLLAIGCGPEVYEAHGVIRDVLPDEHRVEIEHEEIPGLMEAMTMHFEVPDSSLLARMQVGQVIDFRIERDGGRVRIVEFWPADERTGEPQPSP